MFGSNKQFCQSCMMPLDGEKDKGGTNKDGSLSTKYCSLCYKDGEFIDPDLTLDEMKVIVNDAMKEKDMNRFLIWFTVKSLPKLERWKNVT